MAAPQNLRGYPQACFAAGTPILWEGGSKPVEDIRPGDRVWARDEFDPAGPLELKAVEECFVRHSLIWHVHVGGQVIRTTDEHPFWVQGQGWTRACELKVGDLLVGPDGHEVAVEDLRETGDFERVYNFRVADYHTYYVGSQAWGFSVWAHNTCTAVEVQDALQAENLGRTNGRTARNLAVLANANNRQELVAELWRLRHRQGATPEQIGRIADRLLGPVSQRTIPLPRIGQSITMTSEELSALRAQRSAYEINVRELRTRYNELRRAGRSPEELARTLSDDRLQLEQQFRQGLPPQIVEEIELRQLARYGNRLGATVEQMLDEGKTWEDIAEGAMTPGGRDLLRVFFDE